MPEGEPDPDGEPDAVVLPETLSEGVCVVLALDEAVPLGESLGGPVAVAVPELVAPTDLDAELAPLTDREIVAVPVVVSVPVLLPDVVPERVSGAVPDGVARRVRLPDRDGLAVGRVVRVVVCVTSGVTVDDDVPKGVTRVLDVVEGVGTGGVVGWQGSATPLVENAAGTAA